MKRLISALFALAIMATVAAAQTPYIDPNTGAMRIYNVPYGTRFGLEWKTDTLHVTTDEKGWIVGSGAVMLTIINPNNTYLLYRLSNAAGLPSYLGAYGTREIYAPGSMEDGFLLDSLFIDGSGACTVYIDWWE